MKFTHRNLSRIVGLALVLSLALPAAHALAQDMTAQQRERLYREVKPGIVLVWASASAQIRVAAPIEATRSGVTIADGEALRLDLEVHLSSFGSGFIVSPDGYIVTNAHVIQLFHEQNEEKLQGELLFAALEDSGFFEREAIIRGIGDGAPLTHDTKIRLTQRLMPYATFRVEKDLDAYLQNWRRFAAEVKEYSPPLFPFTGRLAVPGSTFATGKDIAILKIEGRDFPTLGVGDSDRMAIGANVTAGGYPAVATFNTYLHPERPMQASFTRGQIASLKVDVKGTDLIQIDAAVTAGNSGGPVLSDRGEVIGMTTMGAEVQGFNYAVPTNTITEFIRAAGVTPQASLFDRIWRDGLDHFFRGQAEALPVRERRAAFNAAIAAFDEVERLMPGLPDNIELRQQAVRRINELPAGDAPSRMPQIIGLILLAGLLLGGAGLWLRGRSGSAQPAPAPRLAAEANGGGRLVVTSGPLQGNQFAVTASGLKIGRDPGSCEIVLTEPTVSREHAVLYVNAMDHGLMIKNLSGTNTTLVNDRAITEATLRPGDRIKIGSSILSYEPN